MIGELTCRRTAYNVDVAEVANHVWEQLRDDGITTLRSRNCVWEYIDSANTYLAITPNNKKRKGRAEINQAVYQHMKKHR